MSYLIIYNKSERKSKLILLKKLVLLNVQIRKRIVIFVILYILERKNLPLVPNIVNTSVHSSIGKSPTQKVFENTVHLMDDMGCI